MFETERRRSKAEERAYALALADLEQQEREVRAIGRHMSAVPRDWDGLDRRVPVEPRKDRVTVRLDADMLAWFRSLGRGHQARMNAVLRAYMNFVVAKALDHKGDRTPDGRPI